MVEESIWAANPIELAWAAGFWDGEGSCGCYRKNDGKKRKASNSYLRASVNQIDREVLDRFCEAVGLGKVYGPYVGITTQWAWQLHGEKVRLMFERLWPYLSRIKKEQAFAAYAKHDERDELGKGSRTCPPGCTCARHSRYSTEGLSEKQIRRREKMREYQARYRSKAKEAAT